MTIVADRSLFLVHSVDTDPLSPAYLGPDCSAYPGASCKRVGATDWYLLRFGGWVVAVFRSNHVGALGLYSAHGPIDALAAIAAQPGVESLPAREAWRRRTEYVVARRLQWWRHFRIDGFVRNSEGDPVAFSGVRHLTPYGGSLGTVHVNDGTQTVTFDPFPWDLDASGQPTTQALAVVRVTAITRPALPGSLLGWGLDHRFEDEPDPGV